MHTQLGILVKFRLSDPVGLLGPYVVPLVFFTVLDLSFDVRVHVLILGSVVPDTWKLAVVNINLLLEVLSRNTLEHVGVVLLWLDFEHGVGSLDDGFRRFNCMVKAVLVALVILDGFGLDLPLLDLLVVVRFLRKS